MQTEETEKVNSTEGFDSPVRSSVEIIKTNQKKNKQTLVALLETISAAATQDDHNHQVFIRCLAFLVNADSSDEGESDLPDDLCQMLTTAVLTILKSSTAFSMKLKNEWMPLLPEFIQAIGANVARRRPRSLTAVPTYESPLKLSRNSIPRVVSVSPQSEESGHSQDSPDRQASQCGTTKPKNDINWFWIGGDVQQEEQKPNEKPSQKLVLL